MSRGKTRLTEGLTVVKGLIHSWYVIREQFTFVDSKRLIVSLVRRTRSIWTHPLRGFWMLLNCLDFNNFLWSIVWQLQQDSPVKEATTCLSGCMSLYGTIYIYSRMDGSDLCVLIGPWSSSNYPGAGSSGSSNTCLNQSAEFQCWTFKQSWTNIAFEHSTLTVSLPVYFITDLTYGWQFRNHFFPTKTESENLGLHKDLFQQQKKHPWMRSREKYPVVLCEWMFGS